MATLAYFKQENCRVKFIHDSTSHSRIISYDHPISIITIHHPSPLYIYWYASQKLSFHLQRILNFH